MRRLRDYRADSERAERPLQIIASCNDAHDLDGYRRLDEIGVTHLNTMPWVFYAGAAPTLEEKCDGIRRFGDEVIAALS